MQIHIEIKLASPLMLPINYNHIQQAAIYDLMSGEEGISDFAHDHGFRYGSRSFKMFCFSQLKGDYSIHDKKIVFNKNLSFDIRSQSDLFIFKMMKTLNERGIRLGDADIDSIGIELSEHVIKSNSVIIKMKSPVTVHYTDDESGKKVFLAPDDPEFYSLICDNFIRKYAAYYGTYPATGIHISAVNTDTFKKTVTFFNRAPIVGWHGEFKLEGDPGYINFLYNTGIGSKNSQGFGLFEEMI